MGARGRLSDRKKEITVSDFTRPGALLVSLALVAWGCVPVGTGSPQIPCNATPSPGVCCDILWGSLHGTVKDTRGQPQSGVMVTLQTKTGAPLGDCYRQASVTTDDEGRYAFNTVPFDVPLVVVATSPRLGSQTANTTVIRGPMVYLDFTF
jgi:hypothetical protein